MSKNKTNLPTKPAVPAVTAPAATPVVDPVAPATKAPDEAKPEQNKIQVRSTTGGTFINPFTHEEIGPAPVTVTNDGWLKSQVDAKKIEQV